MNWRHSQITFLTTERAVLKAQPKTLTENEWWCLAQLYPTGFVPLVERLEPELLKIELIEFEPVTDPHKFMMFYAPVLKALEIVGIRHGDLSEYSVIPHKNRPYLIDFAESRLWDDPREDKRPEGDAYWLAQTMKKYARGEINASIHQRL